MGVQVFLKSVIFNIFCTKTDAFWQICTPLEHLCVCSICEVCRYMCSINVCRVYMCCIYACTAHILVARTCVAWTCSSGVQICQKASDFCNMCPILAICVRLFGGGSILANMCPIGEMKGAMKLAIVDLSPSGSYFILVSIPCAIGNFKSRLRYQTIITTQTIVHVLTHVLN